MRADKKSARWAWGALAGACLIACSSAPSTPPSATPAAPLPPADAQQLTRQAASLSVEEAVYDIGPLPNIPTTLADDPRRATVEALCTPCHSARYITAQPPLAANVWQAEVTKMIEGFGAVIPDDKRADVEGYLVTHYGPDRKATSFPQASRTLASGAGTPPTLKVYQTYCIACHGPQGQGVPGAFPPLAKHAAVLGQSEDGRAYMIDVVLHGLVGPIQVEGTPYKNMMPPLAGRLSDAEVASVLNDVRQAWPHSQSDDLATISAEDVKLRRAMEQTPQQTYKSRPRGN